MERYDGYFGFIVEGPAIGWSVHPKGDVSVPGPTPEEIALQKQQLELIQEQRAQNELLKPYFYQLAGLKEVDGKLVPMTEEEQLAAMNTAQRKQYDVSKLQLEQYEKALKGELPLSQAVENELARQRADLETYMSRKLGPNWRQSTPGIQALAEFDKKANALREEQMYGKQTGASAMSIAQQDYYNQLLSRSASAASSPLGTYQGLMGSIGQALQPYQLQRQMQLQANMANAQSGSALWGGLGSLVGTGLMAGASYFGGPAAAAAILAKNNMRGSGSSAYGGFGP